MIAYATPEKTAARAFLARLYFYALTVPYFARSPRSAATVCAVGVGNASGRASPISAFAYFPKPDVALPVSFLPVALFPREVPFGCFGVAFRFRFLFCCGLRRKADKADFRAACPCFVPVAARLRSLRGAFWLHIGGIPLYPRRAALCLCCFAIKFDFEVFQNFVVMMTAH